MNQHTPTFAICTLGCRVNQYESQGIAEGLISLGYTQKDFSSPCDLYVINTCAVTQESSRKSRQMIHRAHKTAPQAAIMVTGCEAQRTQEELLTTPGVTYLCGNRSKTTIVERAKELLSDPTILPSAVFPPLHGYESMTITSSERTRAYVKIQDGCNSRCAYCIIPALRGKVCSRPLGETVCEIENLAKNGYREVVLTGIETGAYEFGLDNLLEQVNKIQGIERIRLGSMDPACFTSEWIRRVSSLEHVMPHFHLSLQSGCDETLKRMRRRYLTSQAELAINNLRQAMPKVMFTADVIVGFPGETDTEFQQTYDFIDRCGFVRLHIFPYSKRPGTAAAEMPCQIPSATKSERLQALTELKNKMRQRLIAPYLGRSLPVLFEQWKNGIATGHTDNFLEVSVQTDTDLDNQIRLVQLEQLDQETILGNLY